LADRVVQVGLGPRIQPARLDLAGVEVGPADVAEYGLAVVIGAFGIEILLSVDPQSQDFPPCSTCR
jgi:hypothetical protein